MSPTSTLSLAMQLSARATAPAGGDDGNGSTPFSKKVVNYVFVVFAIGFIALFCIWRYVRIAHHRNSRRPSSPSSLRIPPIRLRDPSSHPSRPLARPTSSPIYILPVPPSPVHRSATRRHQEYDDKDELPTYETARTSGPPKYSFDLGAGPSSPGSPVSEESSARQFVPDERPPSFESASRPMPTGTSVTAVGTGHTISSEHGPGDSVLWV